MSSRKKVLVKISFQADVESTCNVAAPPKSGFSPAVPLDPLGITAKPKIDRDPFVNFEFAYPDDCTWNPRLHAIPTGGRRFICRRCQKKFLRKRDLNKHLHTIHGVLAYVCKIRGCTQRFETMTGLINHRARVHLFCRPRSCRLCNRKFDTEKSLMMHLRWHNQRPFRCKGCTCNFQTHKQWIQHRRIEHPVIKSQQKPKLPPIKKTVPLSKKEEEDMQALLAKLPVILPKPPRGSHLKIPISPFHPLPSSSARELRPLMPASFVNSFPGDNYVPIYSSRPSSVIDNGAEQLIHPPINAILPTQYPQANCENVYPIDSSYYIPSLQQMELDGPVNNEFGVDLEADFGMPPVEVVDLNTYPVEVTSLTDFNWSNSGSYPGDHNQNWLQPITPYGDGHQDSEVMQMVEETLQSDLTQNL